MIRPIKERVLVKQDPRKEKTTGGLFVPQGKEIHDNYGTVIAVGPDNKDVVVGDRVLFARKPGSALNPDNREGSNEYDDLLMLGADDILAVIDENPVDAETVPDENPVVSG